MLANIFPLPPKALLHKGKRCRTTVDYGLMRTTREGLYSMLLPRHVRDVLRAFAKEMPLARCEMSGLDTTACVGGDICNLATAFPHLTMTALEINPDALAALRHNVDALGLTARVEIRPTDSVEFVRGHPASGESPYDFVYCDPPWGGPGAVRGKKSVMLQMSGAPVTDLVKRALATGVAPLFVLKAPPNFDKGRLLDELARAGFRPSCRSYRILRDFDLHFVRGARVQARPPDQVFAQVGQWVREGNAAGDATLTRAASYLSRRCDVEPDAARALLADFAEGGSADGLVLNELQSRLTLRAEFEPEPAPAQLLEGALHFVGGAADEKPPSVLFLGSTQAPPGSKAVPRGSGRAPELPAGQFDVIVIDTILYTIPNVVEFLATLKDRLAPGGAVAVREHDILESYVPFFRIVQYCGAVFAGEPTLRRRPGAAFDNYRKSVVSHFHTREDWCRIFATAGFKIRAESRQSEVKTLHRFAVFMTANP